MRLFRIFGFRDVVMILLGQVAFVSLSGLLFSLTACGGGGGRDSLSPVADFTFPVDGQTVSGIVTIQVTATDNSGKVVRVEFFVDGQIIGEDTTPPFTVDWNTLQVNNGPHTLTARPWDPSGNSSSKSITVTVQNDIIPPDTIIDSGPSTRTKETTATFQFHSTEPNSTFQCSFDLQPWQECSSPYTLSGVTEGSHNFRIRAIDASGNVDSSPAEWNWTVDLTPPSSPTNLTASSGDEEVVLDWDDVSDPNFGGYNIYRSIPPGDFSRINTSPLTDSNFTDTSVTNDTTYEYYVTAVDDVGNESVPSNRQQATPVAVYPETTLNSGPCNLQTPCITKETTATFEFSADIPFTFECKLDSDSWGDCASPISYSNLSEGPHQFEVRAIATTGKKRTDPTPASFNWTVDITPPQVTITSGPANPTNQTSATFEFTSTNTSYQCKLDAGAWEACTSPKTYPGPLAEGPHRFEVHATDEAGNTGPPATYDWVIDITPPDPPTLTSTSPPSPSKTSTTPTINGTAEPASTINLYTTPDCTGTISGTGNADNAGNFGIGVTVSPNSTTTFYATATDLAGNTSSCSEGISYTHDDIPPAPPILTSTSPPSPSNNIAPSINGTAEPHSTVRLYTASDCTGPESASGPANSDGNFSIIVSVTPNSTTTFYATATDLAGNTSSCSEGISYTHDDIAPDPPILLSTSPPSPSNTSTTPTINGNAEPGSTINLYTTPDCTGTISGTGNADDAGNFSIGVTVSPNSTTTFYATATDLAGNTSSCSPGISYTHDDIAPDPPILTSTSPPSPSNTSTTPTINGTAEPASTINLYTTPDCTGDVAASGPADNAGNFSISVSVPANSTTTFYATATDPAGNTSSCSEGISYTHDDIPPTIPTNLTAVAGDQSVSLDWNDSTDSGSGLAGYNVYRSLNSGGPYEKVNPSPVTISSYMDTGLTNGTTYYYVVTAVDNATNESGFSNEASATPQPPIILRLFASSDNDKLLGWDNPYTINGDVPPDQEVSGNLTQLNFPDGIFYDRENDRLFVANYGGSSILRFENFSTLNGNIPPDGILAGPNTTLSGPARVFLDPANDWLYVSDYANSRILVFANASSLDGDVAPIRTIEGPSTQLFGPEGIAVDLSRNILYVANSDGNSILIWDNADSVNGDVPPNRVISGVSTLLAYPSDIFIDISADHLYVANFFSPSVSPEITIYHNASTADGDISPSRCINTTVFAFPFGLYLDTSEDMLFLGSSGGGGIQIFHNATTRSDCAEPGVDPDRQIIGGNTQLANAWDVQI